MKFIYTLLSLTVIMLSSCTQHTENEIGLIFYPDPPLEPRLQYLYTLVSESDIGAEQTTFEEYILGPELQFKGIIRPYDISTSKGKIYIIDRNYDKIFYFDLKERKLEILEDSNHPYGKPVYAGGIWATPDDFKYIADIKRKQVLVYDAEDRYVGSYGDETVFMKPVDIAVYQDKIYVADYMKHQVIVLDKNTGQQTGTIGEPGDSEEYQLNRPTHVTVDYEGNIYVTDAFHFQIKKFSPEGQHLYTFGYAGDTPGSFARPKGVAVDREGRVYVVDAASEVIQVFNKEGQLLLDFAGSGGEINNLWLPAGITIDYDNIDYFQNFADKDFVLEYLIYVANMAGPGRTNVYGFGEWTGDKKRLDTLVPLDISDEKAEQEK